MLLSISGLHTFLIVCVPDEVAMQEQVCVGPGVEIAYQLLASDRAGRLNSDRLSGVCAGADHKRKHGMPSTICYAGMI